MKKIFLTTSLLLSLVLSARAEVEIGEPAPDFTLKDSKDNPQKLSAFAGKFVVLEWLNPDCPFVKKQYSGGNMQKLQKEYLSLIHISEPTRPY